MLSGELRPVMLVCVFAWMTSSASPDPGRALDADGGRLAEVGGDAVVALERRLDDLLLDLAVERDGDLVARSSWRTSISGSCSASWPSAARSEPCSSGLRGEHDRLERRPREPRRRLVAGRRVADRVADPDGTEAADRGHLPAVRMSRRGAPAGANTLIEDAFASSPPPRARAAGAGACRRTGAHRRRARPMRCARS